VLHYFSMRTAIAHAAALAKPRKATPKKHLTRAAEHLVLAKELGLLNGGKTQVIRGRMPAALVKEAKRNTGISSDTKLLETALANLAVQDEYMTWLFSQRGSISPDIDLDSLLL
jgi:hypothetical protein